MKYIRIIIFIIILLILFIPNINAEDLNLYELKLYEITEAIPIKSEKADAIQVLSTFLTINVNDENEEQEEASFFDQEDNHLFSIIVRGESEDTATISLFLAEELPYLSRDFVFDEDALDLIDYLHSSLSEYDGIRLILDDNYDKKQCDSVCISRIRLKDKSSNTTINKGPTYDGLVLGLDVSFKVVDDYVTYKLELDNPTDTEYEISSGEYFSPSEYIKYEYSIEDNDNLLKAHSTKTMQVTVRYNKEVPLELQIDGYKEQNETTLHLLNEEGETPDAPIVTPTPTIDIKPVDEEVKVPDTYVGTSVLIIFIIIAVLGYISYNKLSSKALLILIPIILIPVIIYAAEPITVKISVDVSIKGNTYQVAYNTRFYSLVLKEGADNYQKTSYSNCKDLYIGDEKYDYCDSVLIIDNNKYLEGETVEVKAFVYKTIHYTELNRCTYDTYNKVYHCSADTELEDVPLDKWDYIVGNTQFSDYPTLPTDEEVMNFRNENGSVDFNIIGTEEQKYYFTMPNHNVLLTFFVIL